MFLAVVVPRGTLVFGKALGGVAAELLPWRFCALPGPIGFICAPGCEFMGGMRGTGGGPPKLLGLFGGRLGRLPTLATGTEGMDGCLAGGRAIALPVALGLVDIPGTLGIPCAFWPVCEVGMTACGIPGVAVGARLSRESGGMV